MGKAITYNNAGIVEAIKRQSGSIKFYKPSYQGIIEAIEDWNGGGGSGGGGGGGTNVLPPGSNLPNTGNTEGDLVVIPNPAGDYFMYVFANGKWERLHVTTEDVETAGSAPFEVITDDGVTLKHQADINAYLNDRITTLSEKGYDDGPIQEKLDQEIADRQAGDAALLVDISVENQERTDADAALQAQIDELPVTVSDLPPDGEDGDLWFKSTEDSLQLYVFYGDDWTVASPPVSTDDIDNALSLLDVKVSNLEATTVLQGQSIADQQSALYNLGKGVVALQEAENNVDLQAVLDTGNVADKGAEFGGTIRIEPATEDYEAATYGQVESATNLLQAQIDQLVPSLERGQWIFDTDGQLQGGEFSLIAVQTQETFDKAKESLDAKLTECNEAANGDQAAIATCNREYTTALGELPEIGEEFFTDDWTICTKIQFSAFDANGNNHTFTDVKPGQTLDMACDDDYSFMIAEVKGVTTGMWYEDNIVEVAPLRSRGHAHGTARVKIFNIDDEIDAGDLDLFLPIKGGTMTGKLTLEQQTSGQTTVDFLNADKKSFIEIGSDSNSVMRIRVQKDMDFKIGTSSRQVFRVYGSSSTCYLGGLKDLDENSGGDSAANKNYVDALHAPAKYAWLHYTKSSKTPGPGEFYCNEINYTQKHTRLYFNPTPAIGPKFEFPKDRRIFTHSGTSSNPDSPCCSKWIKKSDGTWKLEASFKIDRVETDSSGILIVEVGQNGWGSGGMEGETQYFTIGGLF